MNFVAYFLVAFLLSLLINAGFIFFRERRGKNKSWRRLGGIGIISAFLFGLLFNPELIITDQIFILAFSAGLILVFGVMDDFFNFSWKKQLFFQSFLVVLLIFFGYSINQIALPDGINLIRFDQFVWNGVAWLSVVLILTWVLLMMNAVGWSDGIDGLSGTIALLGSLTLFILSLTSVVNQPAMAILAVIFGGSVLGFLVFNWPKGRIEAGTSGSYFLGFFLATTAIMAGTKIATIIVVLAIPLVDFFWVISERFLEGKSIFKRDDNKRHLHYKLRAIGWSDQRIVLSYFIFVLLILCGYFLATERWVKLVILGGEILLITSLILLITNKTPPPSCPSSNNLLQS
ncbi:MAG TPA: undecaprenyl/decaprenyl-phosphate alpha-N-acetylglucosaminyl 1-phosphate transferase [Candidatus Moranbacteria bacterium]|nr:undecaprenyl/decaprenyl-phosphate alpha-N-acetylglucosaminyl 1-phosphate transferase [Candidatus Moranbacteria bacterium]